MKVYQAINAVQAALATEGISKDQVNQQQGYKFRGIDSMYNAIAPLLAKYKLCILPAFAERVVTERVSKKGDPLFYVNVAGTFTFVSAEDGTTHKVGPFYGEAMDSGDKATNKAQSASFKYMAMQTFCIPTEGDNDADATTHEVRPNTATQVAVDEFARMAPDEQQFIRDHAATVIALAPEAGAKYIEAQHFDDEEKLAIWSLLPSPVRSALKKVARPAPGREGVNHEGLECREMPDMPAPTYAQQSAKRDAVGAVSPDGRSRVERTTIQRGSIPRLLQE